MSTVSRSLFATPSEFASLCAELADRVAIVLDPGQRGGLRLWNGQVDALLSAQRIYLGESLPAELEQLTGQGLAPASYGWVQMDVPRVEGAALLLTQFGGKTEVYDASGARTARRDVVRLYERLWRTIKHHFRHKLHARNTQTGAVGKRSSAFATDGAIAWQGPLRQAGVANLEFFVLRPS